MSIHATCFSSFLVTCYDSLFISGRFRGSGCLGAAFFTAPRSLPCLQVLLSLVTNRLVETRVLLSLVPGTFGQSEGTVADDS